MSLPEEVEQNIAEKIQQTPGVIAFHHLRTRKNGNTFIIDMHIKVDPDSSIVKAHDIATQVEESLKTTFGKRTQVNIHIVFAKKLSDTDTVLSFFPIFVFEQSLINCF